MCVCGNVVEEHLGAGFDSVPETVLGVALFVLLSTLSPLSQRTGQQLSGRRSYYHGLAGSRDENVSVAFKKTKQKQIEKQEEPNDGEPPHRRRTGSVGVSRTV